MFSWNKLHQGVKAIFFVQIVNRAGDFVVPFLTLILTQVQGLSPTVAGAVVTLATGLGSLGGLLAGKLSDGRSRRDVLVVFLGTSGLLLAAAGFAPAHWTAAVAMVVAGFFLGAMRPVLSALIADLSTPETRRAAFSLSYLGVNIGVAVGPLLAAWFFDHALNWLFWVDGLSTAVALGVLVVLVPRQTRSPESSVTAAGSVRAFVGHRILLSFGLLFLAYHVAYAQMIFTLSLQLVDLFGAQGPQTFGFVWALNAVLVVALTPLTLRWTRNLSNLSSMALGMAFFAVGAAVFLFHPNLVWVLISAAFWTTGEVLFSIHLGDLVTTESPPEMRGRFQGYVQFLGSLGFVAAPLASGTMASLLGLGSLWWLATLLALGTGAGFIVLRRVQKLPG